MGKNFAILIVFALTVFAASLRYKTFQIIVSSRLHSGGNKDLLSFKKTISVTSPTTFLLMHEWGGGVPNAHHSDEKAKLQLFRKCDFSRARIKKVNLIWLTLQIDTAVWCSNFSVNGMTRRILFLSAKYLLALQRRWFEELWNSCYEEEVLLTKQPKDCSYSWA